MTHCEKPLIDKHFSTGSHKVDKILQSLYARVLNLEQWLKHIDKDGVFQTKLIVSGDTLRYVNFLKTTVVGFQEDAKDILVPNKVCQESHQKEIIMRTIQKICQKDGLGKNVLTFGFSQMSDNPKASVTCVPDIEYRHSNSSISLLQYSAWQLLLARIGDELMNYLLENTSIFILVAKPAVYVQLTGIAIYQMWPYSSGPCINPVIGSSFTENKKKVKINKRIINRNLKNDTEQSENPSKRFRLRQEQAVNTFEEAHKNKASSQHNSHDSNKRKLLSVDVVSNDSTLLSDCVMPNDYVSSGICKMSSVDVVSNDSTMLSDYVSSGICKTSSNSLISGDAWPSSLQVFDKVASRDCDLLRDHVMSCEQKLPAHSSLQSEQCRTAAVETQCAPELLKEQPTFCGLHQKGVLLKWKTTNKRQTYKKKKRKRKHKKSQQLKCFKNVKPYEYHKYIPRQSLLYGKNLKEKFADHFILQDLEPTEKDSLTLLEDVFSVTDVGGDINNDKYFCQHLISLKKFSDVDHTSPTVSHLGSVDHTNVTVIHSESIDHTSGTVSHSGSVDHTNATVSHSGSVDHTNATVSHSGSVDHTRATVFHSRGVGHTRACAFQSGSTDHRRASIYLFSSLDRDIPPVESNTSTVNQCNPLSSLDRDIPPVESNTCTVNQYNPLSSLDTDILPVESNTSTVNQCNPLSSLDRDILPVELNTSTVNQYNPLSSLDTDILPVESNTSTVNQCNPLSSLDTDMLLVEPNTSIAHQCNPLSSLAVYTLPLLQQVIGNHRKCAYWSLLDHYCPTKYAFRHKVQKDFDGMARKTNRFRKPSTGNLLEDFIPHSKVYGFLRAVLKRVVPLELFGLSLNRALFWKTIRTFVSLGKYERLCLGQLMRGIKVKGCRWLSSLACHKEQEYRMAQFLWWLVEKYVFHVIRSFFYLTDTHVYRNRIFYYRKRTWFQLQVKAFQDFQKSVKLQSIPEERVKQMLLLGEALGVSKLRFLPKTQSMRPIVNMSRQPISNGSEVKSINSQLAKLFQVLTFEKTMDAALCNCTVLGIDDAYTSLRNFISDRKTRQDYRSLYFVKTDIKQCFDSVNQPLLFKIIQSILMKDGEQVYVSKKYASVIIASESIKRRFHAEIRPLSQLQPDFCKFVRQKAAQHNLRDIILVDQVVCTQTTTKSLLQLLSAHILNNIVQVGRRYWLQQTGVSQGSVVSSLLVSLYLAHMEAIYLPTQPDELLIRMMDDYLFLTPDRNRAEHFINVMVKGFEDYNCFINVNKILVSFPCQDPIHGIFHHTQAGVIHRKFMEEKRAFPDKWENIYFVTEIKDPFPWCGLLINTTSLEVSADYTRYSRLCATDCLSFDATYKPGLALVNKLKMSLRIRCSSVFFDRKINSEEKILVNVYQIFLFLTRIFHTFILQLPPSQRVESNSAFFQRIVRMIPRFTIVCATRKLKQAGSNAVFPVSLQILDWLNANAFLWRLKTVSGYKQFKKNVQKSKRHLEKKMSKEKLDRLKAIHTAGLTLCSVAMML